MVWKNGEIIPWADATVHVSAHGLHYGSGVFEGIRCYETENGPALFRVKEHYERFHDSAAVYGFEIPYSVEELTEATCELIDRNEFKSCYVRPICFMGSGTLGVFPRNCPTEVVDYGLGLGRVFGRGRFGKRNSRDRFAVAQISFFDDADDRESVRAIFEFDFSGQRRFFARI